jgi:hypothetical protein
MQELAIRRLYASDPDFREICEDHAIATCAQERWYTDKSRHEEYRHIVQELEGHILKYIDKQQQLPRTGGKG